MTDNFSTFSMASIFSKTITCEFADYFYGLYRSNMIEKSLGCVDLDDVDYEDFSC